MLVVLNKTRKALISVLGLVAVFGHQLFTYPSREKGEGRAAPRPSLQIGYLDIKEFSLDGTSNLNRHTHTPDSNIL